MNLLCSLRLALRSARLATLRSARLATLRSAWLSTLRSAWLAALRPARSSTRRSASWPVGRAALRPVAAGALAVLLGTAARAEPPAACPPVATAPTAEQVQAGQRDARDRGFLWRISRDGRSSYLFGTMHVARLDWMFPGPRVSEALLASDTVALELDLLDPEIGRRLVAALAAQPRTVLPAPLQQRLRQFAEAECVPAAALAPLSPEMQVLSLASLSGRRAGLDPAWGIDAFLAGWARGAGKAVVSLETPESQLQALQLATDAERIEFVERGLDDLAPGPARDAVLRLARAWADADLATLEGYEAWCHCLKTAADRALMKRLLDDRNPALADRIAALHAGGSRVFAAVGALHVIGARGLPRLLEQRGYRVERIAYRP